MTHPERDPRRTDRPTQYLSRRDRIADEHRWSRRGEVPPQPADQTYRGDLAGEPVRGEAPGQPVDDPYRGEVPRQPVHGEYHGEIRPPVQDEEIVEHGDSRVRVVRVVCAVIDVACWLFAIVLAIHIFLVIGGANPANGFAQLIESWSAAVSLGLRDLFTPANEILRTLFNDGLAALLWLVIAAVLTNLIWRVALPADERRVWRRRTIR